MADAQGYKRAVGGKLKLKGSKALKTEGKPKKAKKVKKGSKRDRSALTGASKGERSAAAGGGGAGAVEQEARREPGIGSFITSSTAVHGTETQFLKQLKPGDAVAIRHPVTKRPEVRVVKMVLSDTAIGINKPFSTDLSSRTSFECLLLPRVKEDNSAKEEAAKKRRLAEEELFAGTYGGKGGGVVTYRRKVGGGYRIVSEEVDRKLTREELLDLRSKKKSDRLC